MLHETLEMAILYREPHLALERAAGILRCGLVYRARYCDATLTEWGTRFVEGQYPRSITIDDDTEFLSWALETGRLRAASNSISFGRRNPSRMPLAGVP